MHELSVTTHLLELALKHAHTAHATRITDLHIVAGQLSSMIDESVQMYWEIVSQGTIAQESKLHFRRIPAEMLCSGCNHRYRLDESDLGCPACGSSQVRIVAGDEFYLDSIEIEGAEDTQDERIKDAP